MPTHQPGSFHCSLHSRATTLLLGIGRGHESNNHCPFRAQGPSQREYESDTSKLKWKKQLKGIQGWGTDLYSWGIRGAFLQGLLLSHTSKGGRLGQTEGHARQKEQRRELARPVVGPRNWLWLPWSAEVLPPVCGQCQAGGEVLKRRASSWIWTRMCE